MVFIFKLADPHDPSYDKGPYELWFHALNIGDVKEDRVGYDTTDNERTVRTVDGLQLYGGVAFNF